MNVPEQIQKDAGPLISKLIAGGWTLVDSRYSPESFGDWYVDLQNGTATFRIAKDRSQYAVHGTSTDELKSAGLWKAFNDWDEISRSLKLGRSAVSTRSPTRLHPPRAPRSHKQTDKAH